MLVVDMWIKRWCETHMAVGQFIAWPWPGVLELRMTHNEGIAFGLAQGKGNFFTPIALAISVGAAWYSMKHPKQSPWFHTSMALLAAGALGNLYDRVTLGYVRDMFATRFIQFPVFNWADACITVATIVLILVWTKEAFDAKGAKTEEKLAEAKAPPSPALPE
jgi:signal peptidase II